jgi:hypothetical protein
MAIDLNKDVNELKYYYSENGKTIGPFSLEELLEQIDAETLVYREGIDWTNAKDVEELTKLVKPSSLDRTDKEPVSHGASLKKKLLVLLGILITIMVIGMGISAITNKNNSIPIEKIEVKIYSNVKKRNKIIIGSLSIMESNAKFNTCLKDVFGDRTIKFSSYNKINNALLDMKNEEMDILILKESEIKDLQGVLDISEALVWEGYSEDIYIAIPKNNQTHLQNITKCFKK